MKTLINGLLALGIVIMFQLCLGVTVALCVAMTVRPLGIEHMVIVVLVSSAVALSLDEIQDINEKQKKKEENVRISKRDGLSV